MFVKHTFCKYIPFRCNVKENSVFFQLSLILQDLVPAGSESVGNLATFGVFEVLSNDKMSVISVSGTLALDLHPDDKMRTTSLVNSH